MINNNHNKNNKQHRVFSLNAFLCVSAEVSPLVSVDRVDSLSHLSSLSMLLFCTTIYSEAKKKKTKTGNQ